jgi:superfamily II DNA or RNA helicase
MEILDNKAVLIRTRTPQKYAVIPKSRIVEHFDGGATVAVYWGLDEARVLRNLGVKKVPSPIVAKYDWPGRYKPMAHQIETASFLTLHRRAFCFNEPGTGKTLAALWAADYLMNRGEVRRVLVICPVSIMHSAWMGDISNSVIHRSAIVAHHSKASRRIEMVQGSYEIVITNYEGVELIAPEIKADGRFDLIVVDEANGYANPQTDRWKALASILTPTTYLWMMTGTPAAQSPVGAYGLAKLVNPSGVPKFLTAWRDKVMNKLTQFKWVPKPSARATVYEALQPAIRFAKKDCIDLPPVIVETREVPMTPQQIKYYKLLKTQMMVQAAGETISAVNAGVMISKLLQVSAGAAYTDDKEVVEFDASPRLKVLMEILEETERKVLIFAMFRSSIDTISAHLEKKGIRTAQIHGDVSAGKRGTIIHDFQNTDNIRVLVMQPQATAHGITLTAADTVIFYGPLMSVEMYLQCIARADRKGQTSDKVTVVHIESSPVEQRLFRAMNGKVTDHALLIDMFSNELKNS